MSSKEYTNMLEKGLASVVRTIHSQSQAVNNLTHQYNTDEFSKLNLVKSLDILLTTNIKGGKIVVCGVGKSYKIGTKLSATLNSLSIQSIPLHPTEALHGDLGILTDKDCILMLTASGNTPELLGLLPHISVKIPIVLVTCAKESKLSQQPQIKALLYTELPHHLKEDTIHGVPAPTVSATLSLILSDSVILALAEIIEDDVMVRKKQFSIKHPGGSIGANLSHLNDTTVSESMMKSFTRDVSSNSSFLSLDQIRNDLNSTSSDDEEPRGHELAVKIGKASPHRIWRSALVDIDEVTFLRNITLYDYWVLTTDDAQLAADCQQLKNAYILQPQWLEFQLTDHLQNLRLGFL